jgi:hypothetical protein
MSDVAKSGLSIFPKLELSNDQTVERANARGYSISTSLSDGIERDVTLQHAELTRVSASLIRSIAMHDILELRTLDPSDFGLSPPSIVRKIVLRGNRLFELLED